MVIFTLFIDEWIQSCLPLPAKPSVEVECSGYLGNVLTEAGAILIQADNFSLDQTCSWSEISVFIALELLIDGWMEDEQNLHL